MKEGFHHTPGDALVIRLFAGMLHSFVRPDPASLDEVRFILIVGRFALGCCPIVLKRAEPHGNQAARFTVWMALMMAPLARHSVSGRHQTLYGLAWLALAGLRAGVLPNGRMTPGP